MHRFRDLPNDVDRFSALGPDRAPQDRDAFHLGDQGCRRPGYDPGAGVAPRAQPGDIGQIADQLVKRGRIM